LLKAILRQVISATQAKKLLHRFVLEFGPAVEREGTRPSGFPSLEEIAALSPERLVACGLGYKARVLPRVAQDLLDAHLEEQIWELPAAVAIERLERLKGVEPWTAHVTICDLRGDWSVYPYEDLAVRRWASRLWPGGDWPREEHAFLSAWQEVNGPSTGIVTCYLLALAQCAPAQTRQEKSPTRQSLTSEPSMRV
jgi:DNA-3-methyladenine glycosylase II